MPFYRCGAATTGSQLASLGKQWFDNLGVILDKQSRDISELKTNISEQKREMAEIKRNVAKHSTGHWNPI